jgi:hypothetical protein
LRSLFNIAEVFLDKRRPIVDPYNIGCSFKFLLKAGVEESIVNTTDYRSRISCLNLTSLFALFVFLLCRLTSGDPKSSIPTLRRHPNEHPIVEDYHNNKISKSPKIVYFKPR